MSALPYLSLPVMRPRQRGTFRAAGGGTLLPLAPLPSSRGGGATPPDADWAVGRPAPEVAAASCVTGFSSPAPPQRSSRALGHSDSLDCALNELAPLYPPCG